MEGSERVELRRPTEGLFLLLGFSWLMMCLICMVDRLCDIVIIMQCITKDPVNFGRSLTRSLTIRMISICSGFPVGLK